MTAVAIYANSHAIAIYANEASLGRTKEMTLKPGHSVGDRAPFIPMKAAQWRMKSKWLDFLAIKRLSPSELAKFWFRTQLTWMEIQLLNLAALLDSLNFIGPNGLTYDHETDHFVEDVTLKNIIHHFTAASQFDSSLNWLDFGGRKSKVEVTGTLRNTLLSNAYENFDKILHKCLTG